MLFITMSCSDLWCHYNQRSERRREEMLENMLLAFHSDGKSSVGATNG